MRCLIAERIALCSAQLPDLTPLQRDVAGAFLRRARSELPSNRSAALALLSEASRVITRPVDRGYLPRR